VKALRNFSGKEEREEFRKKFMCSLCMLLRYMWLHRLLLQGERRKSSRSIRRSNSGSSSSSSSSSRRRRRRKRGMPNTSVVWAVCGWMSSTHHSPHTC